MSNNSITQNAPLTGKFALVTGGSRGIGRGIALKLATRGATVGINYLSNEGAARQTLDSVRALGSDGLIIQADVARPEDQSRMAAHVRQEFGALDIFVNNALGGAERRTNLAISLASQVALRSLAPEAKCHS